MFDDRRDDVLPADGIAVLHRGKLIYERYFGALKPHKPHISMSVTKSFTGTLAGMLVAEGRIDPKAPVTDYVPEFRASAFADARASGVPSARRWASVRKAGTATSVVGVAWNSPFVASPVGNEL